MKVEIETPMCDRLASVAEKVAVVRDFMGWLDDRGIVLATWEVTRLGNDRLTRIPSSDLAFQAFGIDPAELDRERRSLLDEVRRQAGTDGDTAQGHEVRP